MIRAEKISKNVGKNWERREGLKIVECSELLFLETKLQGSFSPYRSNFPRAKGVVTIFTTNVNPVEIL